MRKATKLAAIIIAAMLVPIVPFLVVGELPGERWLSNTDDNALLFAATGTSLLALDIALPIPSSLVGTALGARLGFWTGTLCCWAGLMAGNLAGYGLAHLYPQRLAVTLSTAPQSALVFLSRPVPVFAEAVALAAGANRMPPRPFFIACALGNAAYAIALCGNATIWTALEWRGPMLLFPMLLPVAGWLAWRRLHRRGVPET